MASSIPAARTWLVGQLQTLFAGSVPPVTVVRTGSLEDNTQARDRVEVQNATAINREWRTLGARVIDEHYTIPVFVEATIHAITLAEVETRLWDLVTLVERTVMADPSFGGALVTVEAITGHTDEESGGLANGDLAARFTLGVHCWAKPAVG